MTNTKGLEISASGITKSFAGAKALDNVSLDLASGKVHGLIGANGAGKSTFIKILAGAYQPDAGSIAINGQKTVIANPHVAGRLGLSFIHQDLGLIQDFNAMENITLGLQKHKKFGLLDWASTSKKVQEVVQRIGFQPPLTTKVKHLSVANQWLVAIGRALYQDARFIAMDEPTASLTETEVEMLFSVIRDLTSHGIGIAYVSHRLDEIIEICDEVTVFKDGAIVLHSQTADLTKQQIVNAIAGHSVAALTQSDYEFEDAPDMLVLQDLTDGDMVKNVSLKLKHREILGITGLVGSGRTELALMVFGASPVRGGTMVLEGAPYAPRSPAMAVEQGIVIVPEERRSEGLCMSKSVSFNINLPTLYATRSVGSLPMVNNRKAYRIARDVMDRLRVKARSPAAPASSLSGGNQQKLVIGKWLQRKPRIFIMDEPTRGVDVGARAEIYGEIKRLAQEGASFIVISSDVEELPGLCDRVLVMAEGRISGQLVGKEISKDALLRLSYATAAGKEPAPKGMEASGHGN